MKPSFAIVEVLAQDVRYGARLLRRSPLFGIVAGLSLAIGIGATTAIFTVGDALLFRAPAGVVEADRLVDIGSASDALRIGTVSYSNYLDIRQRSATVSGVYLYPIFPASMSFVEGKGAERIYGDAVTKNFFAVLGTRPAAGRLFDDADDDPVVVLSHRFWTRRFDKDPSAIGRVLHLNGRAFTAIGVAAEGFHGTTIRSPDVWIPIDARFSAAIQDRASAAFLMGARLKPGVSIGETRAELDAIGRALEREHPGETRGRKFSAAPLSPSPDMRGPLAAFVALLLGMAAIVLAVSCTNLTGVLLARAAVRRREMAMRLAIGARRGRLVRQLLTETMILFTLGGAAGLLVAQWTTSLLVRLLPALPIPVEVSFALDKRAFVFAAGVSFAAALLSGLVPALQASRTDLMAAMREDAPRRIGRVRFRSAFVVAQVALSIVLVVVAGLFVRALQRAVSIDPGFSPRGIELADLDLSTAGYTATTGQIFARELVERVRGLPGVAGATVATVAPGSFEGLGFSIRPAGTQLADGDRFFESAGNIVEPGYFDTLRIALVAGRDFTSADRQGAQPVVIVGRATARRFWPDGNAVGQYLVKSNGSAPDATETMLVVGIARDVAHNSLVDGVRELFIYLPYQQAYMSRTTIVARAAGGRSIGPQISALVATMSPTLPIVAAESLETRIAVSRTPQRIAAALSGTLGLAGLLLSAIGIYGITAYVVATRTREIGIRLALGAPRAAVVGIVLRRGMSLVAIGGALGLAAAAVVSQILTALLFGIPPIDPVSFAGAAMLFAGAGLAACYVPMRRATRVSVTDAMRAE